MITIVFEGDIFTVLQTDRNSLPDMNSGRLSAEEFFQLTFRHLLSLLSLLPCARPPARASASFQLPRFRHCHPHHLSRPRAGATPLRLLLSELSFSDALPRPHDRAFQSSALINSAPSAHQDCASAGVARAKQTVGKSAGGMGSRKQPGELAARMAAPSAGGVPGEEEPVIATRNCALPFIEHDGRDSLAHCEEGHTLKIHRKEDLIARFGVLPEVMAFALILELESSAGSENRGERLLC